jgi:hypothetical protein
VRFSITARDPPIAPIGKPPPITLPKQVMSGFTSYFACAPPWPIRNPVMTSSKMSKAPALPAYKIVISLFFFLFIVLVFYLLGWEKLGLDIPVIICKGFVFLSFSFFLFRETIQKIWIKN